MMQAETDSHIPSSAPSSSSLGARHLAVLAAGVLSQTTVAITAFGLAPLASLLQNDMQLSRAEVGILLSASVLGSMVITLPSGWLTDSLDARPILFFGLLFGGALFGAVSFVTSFDQAIALLFLVGLSTGFISPATTKAMMYWFPSRIRSTAMGIKQTGMPIGGVIAATTLPSIALAFGGWRAAVVVVGCAAMGVAGLCRWLYREHPQYGRGRSRKFSQRPWRLGALLADRRLLRVAGFGTFACVIQGSLVGYLSLFLQEVLLLPVVAAGGYLALAQFGGAVGRVGWGVVSDRAFSGRRRPVLLAISTLSALLAAAMSTSATVLPSWLLGLTVCLFGVTAIGWNGVFHTSIGEIAGRELAGTAIGFGLFMNAVGLVAGPPVFGYVVDLTGSYALSWGLLAVSSLAGLVLVAGLPDSTGSEKE